MNNSVLVARNCPKNGTLSDFFILTKFEQYGKETWSEKAVKQLERGFEEQLTSGVYHEIEARIL